MDTWLGCARAEKATKQDNSVPKHWKKKVLEKPIDSPALTITLYYRVERRPVLAISFGPSVAAERCHRVSWSQMFVGLAKLGNIVAETLLRR